MKELAELLGVPDKLPLRNRKGKFDRIVALGVLLSFLAFPKRQRTDLELLWWMDRRKISQYVCFYLDGWSMGGSPID